MSAANTVRFTAEFDDSKLVQSLNRVKSTMTETFSNLPGIQALEQQFQSAQTQLEALEQSTNTLEQSFTGLDSSTSGVNTSLDEIGNAANQAGTDFNTLGSSTQTIEEQLAEIGTTSVTAGQSMTALGGSADTTATSMGALQSNFEGVSGGLTSTNTLFGETTGAMADVDTQAQTTGERMSKIWSKGSAIAIGISATISGIANLVRGFRDYDDAQNRVAKATLALTKAQDKQKTAQEDYNAAVAAYGKNSVEAQGALEDLGKANDNLGIKQTNLSIATKRAGDAQIDIWLGLAGTVTGIGGSIIQSLDAIGGTKGLGGLATKAKSAFSTIGTAIGGLSLSLGGLTKTLGVLALVGAGFEVIGRAWAGALQAGNPFLTKIHEIGLELEKIPVIGPALKAFGDIMNSVFLPDLVAKEAEANKKLAGSVGGIGDGVGAATPKIKDYNSAIVASYDTSLRQESVWSDTAKMAVSVTKGYSMIGVEQQKSEKFSKIATEGFAKLSSGIADSTKAIEPNTEALTANGIAIFKAAEPLPTFIKNQDILTGAFVSGADGINKYEKSLTDAAGAITEFNGPSKEMVARLQAISERAAGVIKFQTNFTSSLTSTHDALFKQAQELGGNELAMAKFGITTDSTDQTIKTANQGLLGYIHTLGGVTPEEQKIIDKNQEWIKTVQEVADKYDTQLNPALVDTPAKLEAITKALEEHAKAMEESKKVVEEAHQAFSKLLDATKVKDFNKALKEMNLKETLGKDFNQAVKDLGPSITEFNNAMTDVQTGLQGLIQFGGKVDFDTFTGGVNQWVDSLQAMAAADPDSRSKEVTTLFDSFRKMSPAQIQQHAGSIGNFITAALNAKDITPKMVTDLFAAFTNENVANVGTAATNTTALGTAAGTAAGPIGAAGTAAGTAATQYDPLQTNILKTATAFDTLVNGIANAVVVFPIPDISPFTNQILTISTAFDTLVNGIQAAKVIMPAIIIDAATKSILTVAKAFDTLVNGINKAKPVIHIDNSAANTAIQQTAKAADALINGINKAKATIHVDNSQALSAIKAVVSAMNSVKSKSVTLTTIKKTVTVGGHGVATAGGHGVVGGSGGGEGESPVPLIAAMAGGRGGVTTTMEGAAGTGNINITIVNRDEFGTEKIRKYKAVMGQDRYIFGSVGTGG